MQDHEFITAQACHRRIGTRRSDDLLRHPFQQLIPEGMSIGQIGLLKMIDIQIAGNEIDPQFFKAADIIRRLLDQAGAVGQAGKRILVA